MGQITAVRVVDGYMSISFKAERARPIAWSDINDLTESLGITDHEERNHTHWAVKNVDLKEVLAQLPAGTSSTLGAEPAFPTDEMMLVGQIRQICANFREIISPLTRLRRANKPRLSIGDEYDVQDLLHMALRALTLDVRPEEPGGNFAGAGSRVDFFVPKARTVIEVKRVRDAEHGRKDVANELLIDRERYAARKDWSRIICLVYDTDHHIPNPVVFKQDLESTPGLPLEVYIVR